ncbi:Cys/Met metabolism PLP-dependent enzyme-domain-containing protein [Apodospora peruviana]|uniref:Cys/Met metabolism PLP-dependent enzyme-domain-containing protein n=1 Tax=Apodospora peruviana TaxID=516989 RepID=A0AAE0ITB8_9PEZI|nr:Cys/Met metabolism PLP-dependent enzyme-domain-containing protein [Apodospora peruviana]
MATSDSGAPAALAVPEHDSPAATVPPVTGPNQLAAAFGKTLSLASRSVHADDYINNHQAVAPPLHVSTTFRYSRNPDDLKQWDNHNPAAPYDSHMYSRDSAPNTTRLEAILTSVLGGPALTYASGLAAFHAMMVFLNPKRIAIGGGYHGCHGVIKVLHKLNGLEQLEIEDDADLARLQKGDIIHVETPLNPTGEARDLAYYRRKADELGCYLTVDATFAPPPLQNPFEFGVDVVMHSGTKYFGGHSDMLSGVLAVRPDRAGGWMQGLREERLVIGGVMGSLEGWLGVRSLRTLELRVTRQSESAQRLVDWLSSEVNGGKGLVSETVLKLQHASLQPEAADETSWLRKQMPNGFGPVFSIWMKSEELAKRLPSKLHLFQHATSLGGVESLIEWRAMTDKSVDRKLLRVSIGVEGWEDLRDDLLQGFQALKDELA